MTFNEEFVGMLLPPTRSVGGVKKVIDDIPTGMKTPLGDALMFMQQYLSQYLRKHPSEVAFVVMMTDAGANIPVNKGADPLEESLEIATHLRLERMECVLVDTKVSVEPNYKARKLAVALEAPYYKIEDLRSSDNILTKKS
jgi:magnesium chelatase subunit D